MRLITYNIYMGACYRGDRLDSICDLLSSLKPDILALQECFGPHFEEIDGRSIAQEKLEQATGLQSLIFSTISGIKLYLLCRKEWKITAYKKYVTDSHGIGLATIEIPGQLPFTVGVVHLDPWNEPERLHQLLWLQSEKINRLILLGDFNSLGLDSYSKEISKLPGQYIDFYHNEPRTDVAKFLYHIGLNDSATVCNNQTTTYPTTFFPDPDCPDIRIDFIMVSGDLKNNIISHKTIQTDQSEQCSDHRPVVADIKIEL